MKKLTKTKKIVIASISAGTAVLLIVAILLIALSNAKSPLEKFASKIEEKQNYRMDVTLSGIPLLGAVTFAYEVDGNIQHIPDGAFVNESYFEIAEDAQYQYSKDADGKWVKEKSDEDLFTSITTSDVFKEIINPDNYEPVKGEKNVYQQKEDVTFDLCKNVVIYLEKDSCTITMIAYSNGMALETVIAISDIGKVDITLPAVD